jgi:hypothetical protein
MIVITYVCFNKSNTTSATSGLELLILPEHTSSPPWFLWSSCCSIFSFLCDVLWLVVHVFVPCLLAIVLCVLHWFKASDYPFIKYLQIFLEYYDIIESKLMECKILGTLFLALVTIGFGYMCCFLILLFNILFELFCPFESWFLYCTIVLVIYVYFCWLVYGF